MSIIEIVITIMTAIHNIVHTICTIDTVLLLLLLYFWSAGLGHDRPRALFLAASPALPCSSRNGHNLSYSLISLRAGYKGDYGGVFWGL